MSHEQASESLKKSLAHPASQDRIWLDFAQNLLTEADFELLVETIRTRPQLHSVTLVNVSKLRKNGFSEKEVDALAEAIASRGDIRRVAIRNAELDNSAKQKLLTALQGKPQLEAFDFYNAGEFHDNQQTIDMLCELAANSPELSQFSIKVKEWEQPLAERLAEALRDKTRLTDITLIPPPHSTMLEPIARALLDSPHPNLCNAPLIADHTKSPEIYKAIQALVEENEEHIEDLQDQVLTHHEVDTHHLFGIEARLPMLIATDVQPHIFSKRYETILDGFPLLAEDAPVTAEALFKPDEHEWTPLDNPRNWAAHPQLLEELRAQGALDKALLNREAPSGYRLLDYAIAFAPHESLKAMHKAGIQMGDLLAESPPEARETLCGIASLRGALPQLFHAQEWQGHKAESVMALIHEMPDDQQVQIRNRTSLNIQLQSAERQSMARGR